jgi:cytochrome-b5 reductase
LPHGLSTLSPDPALPTGLKVVHDKVEKSYSPISHPAEQGICDLLVKHYSPRPEGGVSNALCSLLPGQEAEMRIKPPRSIHGSPYVAHRWRHLGLLSCGTGIAPFVQTLRILRQDPTDRTEIRLLSVNRSADDILLKDELDHLAAGWPGGRLKVTYALTGSAVPPGWSGVTGHGSCAMARDALPPPDRDGESSIVMVCGTDGFVESWAGPRRQRHAGANGGEAKVQGPLGGLLQEVGFREDQVYKY